jgi:DNA-binding CsgD family transcriptional regulator
MNSTVAARLNTGNGPPGTAARPDPWPALFEAAFRLSASPMLLLDQDHVILDVNAACEVTFQRPRSEVIGKPGDPLVALGSRKLLAQVWKVLARDGRVTCKLDWIRGDGRLTNVDFACVNTNLGRRGVVLCVVLETRLRPLRFTEDGAGEGEALTLREIEVVSHIAMGRRIHEIADLLFISPTTARTHARNAMRKLGARSQAQLVAIAVADGLLDPQIARPD